MALDSIIDLNFTPEGREGFRLIAQIRKESPETFIVACSAFACPRDLEEETRLGAGACISKDGELMPQLGTVLRRFTARR